MSDPTNRNDPFYSQNKNYVWSGGRWQYVQNPNASPETGTTNVTGTTTGSSGDWGSGFDKIGQRTARFFEGRGSGEGALRGQAAVARGVNAAPIFNYWDQQVRNYMNQPGMANPYNAQIADQSRAAQLALINQMRGQMNGPSLAGLQGQRAMAQSGQQALGAAAMGAPGRAAMMQAGQVGGGMAGDIGQARLAEVMRAQAGMGGASSNLRGADLRSAAAAQQAGLSADKITAGRQQFGLGTGTSLSQAELRNALENYKFGRRVESDVNAKEKRAFDQSLDMLKNYLGFLATMGMGGTGSPQPEATHTAPSTSHTSPGTTHD